MKRGTKNSNSLAVYKISGKLMRGNMEILGAMKGEV